MAERPAVRRIIDEPDPARQLALYAHTQPGIWSRVGPLLQALDAAANSDPPLAELRQQLADERRLGLRAGLGQLLQRRGALRPGVSADRAGDIVYAVCGRANYEALVLECGWTQDEYRTWLTKTLVASLLTPPGNDHRP